MATEKPNLNRVWAAGAPTGNVVDPDTTSPGKFDDGWLAEVPPFEHFNFLQKLFTQGLAHNNEEGVNIWDTDTTYPISAIVKGSDGELYSSLVAQSGNNPVTDDGSIWYLSISGTVNLKAFGAIGDGVADDSQAIKAAHDSAISKGIKIVTVPSGIYNIPLTRDTADAYFGIDDVIWIGSGKFINGGKTQVREYNSSSVIVDNNIIPEKHLRQFAQEDNPVIVIAGDSLSTDKPTITHDEIDSMWGMIQRTMTKQNHDLNFDFQNRAIGSSTWTNVNPNTNLEDTGLTLPSWAGAGTQPWLDYIEALNPDVLFLAWGMNDTKNFVTAQFRAVLDHLQTWSKVPDIIFINTMVPSRMTNMDGISDFLSQEGRDFNAGYIRTWAEYQGYGLIDLNRQYNILRYGIDVTKSKLLKTTTSRVSTSTTYTVPDIEECKDFGWDIDFNNISGTFWGSELRFAISPHSPNFSNSESFVDISDDGGFLKIELIDNDDVPGRYFTNTTLIVTPAISSNFNITFFVKSGYLSILLDDVVLYEGRVRRHGGIFRPKVSFANLSVEPMEAFFFMGESISYSSVITDRDMWGGGDGGVEGGNDINHPTSLGANTVYSPLFDAIDFRQRVQTEGNSNFPNTNERKVGIRKKNPSAVHHITKGTEVSGVTIDGDANHRAIEGPDCGESFIIPVGGAVRAKIATPNNSFVGGWVYNDSTNIWSFFVNGSTVINLEDNRLVIDNSFQNLGGNSALVISSGEITVTQTACTIDTEASAATDDLDTINGGIFNDLLYISAANSTNTIVVKHATDNIRLNGQVDFILNNSHDQLVLRRVSGSIWVEVSRSSNGV